VIAPLLRHARHRQDAVDMAHAAIQTQFTQNQRVIQVARHLAGGGENANSDGQIIGRPLFAQIGRG